MTPTAAKPKPATARIWAAAVLLGLSGLGLLLSVLTGPTAGLAWSGLVDEGLALARHEPGVWGIVWDIRLPRGSGAWLAGALLGLSGALAQTVFRNPLADPYLLGSASGAALGVAGWLVGATALGSAGSGWQMAWQLGTTGSAFVGALAAVLLTVALARGVQQTLRLLLAGVVVGVVLGALSSLLVLLQPEALLRMQSFMWGSTAYLNAADNGLMALVLLLGLSLACLLGRPLDALHLGETTARSLGVPVSGVRAVCLVLISLTTATSVAHTGLIAFVGLAAPHMVKRWLPMASGSWMLLAAAMGGVLLLLADVLARGLLAPLELPVGVMTAVLGGCYLLWLMRRPT